MARGRFLNTTIAKDIQLNSLSIEAHWLYMMTIPHLDRDGLIIADTYVLFGVVCPRRPELIPRIDELIGEWVTAGLVIVYPTHDGMVAFFRGFTKNQQGMHYSREGVSILEPPPGYVRTGTGLERNSRDNGDGAAPVKDDPGDDTPHRPTPDPLPTNSRLTPLARVEVKDQYQVKDQEGDRTRATQPLAPPPPPPPSYQQHPAPGEYIPGVRRPQQNQTKRNCDHFTGQASQHGIGPEPFRLMVDAVLAATGKIALANTNGDLGQQTLNQAKETVITLLEMGRRTVEDVEAVLVSWRENDWRGTSPPTFGQIVEHSSAMLAGTHVTAKRQDTGKKEFASFADYNEWAARHDPDYKRIREGVLIKGMLVKRDFYQPVFAH